MVGDDRQGAPDPELPPYYAQRVDTIRPATTVSVRRRASQPEAEAQAERLFRDFKLGLVTLVVVALLLVAYFWDGEPEGVSRARREDEAVLSIRLAGRRRSEVAYVPAPACAAEAASTRRRPVTAARRRDPVGTRQNAAPRRTARPPAVRSPRPRVYVAKSGDTLSAIALRVYGSAADWGAIFDANRAGLRRPSDLRSGMRLVIPPKRRRQ